jgi:hypothetical protein
LIAASSSIRESKMLFHDHGRDSLQMHEDIANWGNIQQKPDLLLKDMKNIKSSVQMKIANLEIFDSNDDE